MTSLQIAKELALPSNAVTQTFGFIARKGAGKTYSAGKLVELLHAAGARFVVLDIVGNWYGLRLSADGKKPGLQVPVFGGDHGDVPIDHEGGARLATLIVERQLSCVIDVSLMRHSERQRFVADFARELFFAKKRNRSPLMVVLEEAHKFSPQHIAKGQEKMANAIEDIVRLGRNYGLGATLISQRPQSINKEVLNQVECLFVGQLNGAHERDAIAAWVKTQEAGKATETLAALPSLEQGQMVCWSPQWLKFFGKVRIAQKWTFDASATPELGDDAAAVRLEPFDATELAAALSAEDEPEEPGATKANGKGKGERAGYVGEIARLEARIGELELELQVARAVIPATTEEIARLERVIGTFHTAGLEAVNAARDVMARLPDRSEPRGATTRAPTLGSTVDPISAHSRPAESSTATASQRTRNGIGRTTFIPKPPGSSALAKGSLALLTAIAQHREGVTREQLTVLTGYKRSSRDTYLQRLKSAGLITDDEQRLAETRAGRAALGPDFKPLPTGAALRRHWLERLPQGERAILQVVVDRYPKVVHRDEITKATNYLRSSRDTYLQRLRARELIDVTSAGVKASGALFQ